MSKVVLIDFSAEWCGPCKMQDPIIDELGEKFKGQVEFKKIDVDANMDMSSKYAIHAVPTLILEKDGTVFKKYVGVTRSSVLEADIRSALE
ncbi:MAG: thioredoxin domain-containing protein [ANME-2 cluster archaeon]|nr:thioredoxin domain-containing protein [ANME-2 cluster archaeon]